ncbi:unnamed protein product [Adineta steineri]|nr:unnamed protein product [Adineta steineri]CAF4014700.1 unnamed protein product [Adineta steineri]
MDRNLPGNNRFRLNANATSNHDEKLHIFVKLTSSCMEAIETYIQQNKKQNLSNIKFNRNGGEISIPINNNEGKTYSYQILPEDETSEIFQCVKQINRDQLESCSLIEQRIVTNQEERLSLTTNTQLSPSDRPLRKRLIHLLAAGTYKKPEILVRLKSEGGMRDDEKEQLDSLLSSISRQSNSGDFFLLKSILTSGEKKIEEHQVNATNDIPSVSSTANRLSVPIQNSSSKDQISTTTTAVEANSSLINTLNRSGINEEIITSTQNPLSDERMQ